VADLSAQRRDGALPMRQRKFVAVERDNFDQALASFRPELRLQVPRGPGGEGEPLHLDLDFRRLEDFEPDRLLERVPEWRLQLEERRRRRAAGAAPEEIAALDRRLSFQLAATLHHPEFRRLEATWRGLHYLVGNSEVHSPLKVKAFSASKRELSADATRPEDFDGSTLFKKVYTEEFGRLGGEPYVLLVGDYEFGRGPEDLRLLRSIARIAAFAHAPFVAAASPGMFGLESLSDLTKARDLGRTFSGAEYRQWHSFRASEEARSVALTLPRVLARPPYGERSRKIVAFPFEEFVGETGRDEYTWMSAAWAYAAGVIDAFDRHGWAARTRGVEGGGRVTGLPTLAAHAGQSSAADPSSCEVTLPDRREPELSDLGFLPLVWCEARDCAAFLGAQSCQKPKTHFEEDANANARLSAKLNYLLCASRFAHHLKVLGRDGSRGTFFDLNDLERWLNRWIGRYVGGDPAGAPGEPPVVGYYRAALSRMKPLAEARVEMRPVRGKPGWYEAVAWLRPHFQFERPTAVIRLVAEIPNLDYSTA
jgi:type VI secretion system protein ImpC